MSSSALERKFARKLKQLEATQLETERSLKIWEVGEYPKVFKGHSTCCQVPRVLQWASGTSSWVERPKAHCIGVHGSDDILYFVQNLHICS